MDHHVLSSKKRICSAIVVARKRLAKKRRDDAPLLSIPADLLRNIIHRVAIESPTSVAAMQASCKYLKKLSSEPIVYRSMKLDPFHVKSVSSTDLILHAKCILHGNPEMLYRYALIDYFFYRKYDRAQEYLSRAVESCHVESEYLSAVFKLWHPVDYAIREEGLRILQSYDNTSYGKKYKNDCRKKINEMLGTMDIRRLWFIRVSICPTHRPNGSGYRLGCQHCIALREMNFLFNTTNWPRICNCE